MNSKRLEFALSLSMLLAASVCMGQTVTNRAQSDAPAPDGHVGQDSGTGLQEIVVTATRREQRASDVPISIKALSEHDLIEQDIKTMADIAAVTPGLQFATPVIPSTITTISVRGLDSYTGPYMTGIYLDDTPLQGRLSSYGNVGSPMPLIFDLNRVEVERGPQGTLFGSGSEAGTVRFITNQPSLTRFDGSARGEVDSTRYGDPSYEGGVADGGPIIPGALGFRVAAWARQDGGYIDLRDPVTQALVKSNVNSDTSEAFRVALAYQVGDLRMTPSLYYQSVRRGDSGWFDAYYSDPSEGEFNNEPFLPEASTDKWLLPSLKVQDTLPFADLVSTTSYMHRVVNASLDFGSVFFPQYPSASPAILPTPGPGYGYNSPLAYDVPTSAADAVPSLTGQRDKVFTQEVRLASNQPNSRLNWVAGMFYEHHYQEDWQTSIQAFTSVCNPVNNCNPALPNPNPPNPPAPGLYGPSGPFNPGNTLVFSVDQKYTDQQLAMFGQGDFHLTPSWIATVGLRVSREQTQFSAYTPLAGPPSPKLAVANLTQTPTTPKAVLSYHPNESNLFYVSVSKGYRMGGGNGSVLPGCPITPPETFKSDSLWSYEVGAKNELFGNRLEIDSSAYHVDWHNIEQLLNESSCGLNYTTNAGDAEVNGFDLAIRALPTEHLTVALAVNYSNAFFTKNVYEPGSIQVAIEAGDKIGSLPQVMAPWNVTFTPEYRYPLSNGAAVHVSAQDVYTSRNPGPFLSLIPGSPSYLPLEAQNPATNLLNLRAGYTFEDADISVFANNALNSLPRLNRVSDGTEASVYQLYESTYRPLTIGLVVSINF